MWCDSVCLLFLYFCSLRMWIFSQFPVAVSQIVALIWCCALLYCLLQGYMTSLNKDMGYISLAVLYVVFGVVNLFAPMITLRLGLRYVRVFPIPPTQAVLLSCSSSRHPLQYFPPSCPVEPFHTQFSPSCMVSHTVCHWCCQARPTHCLWLLPPSRFQQCQSVFPTCACTLRPPLPSLPSMWGWRADPSPICFGAEC